MHISWINFRVYKQVNKCWDKQLWDETFQGDLREFGGEILQWVLVHHGVFLPNTQCKPTKNPGKPETHEPGCSLLKPHLAAEKMQEKNNRIAISHHISTLKYNSKFSFLFLRNTDREQQEKESLHWLKAEKEQSKTLEEEEEEEEEWKKHMEKPWDSGEWKMKKTEWLILDEWWHERERGGERWGTRENSGGAALGAVSAVTLMVDWCAIVSYILAVSVWWSGWHVRSRGEGEEPLWSRCQVPIGLFLYLDF